MTQSRQDHFSAVADSYAAYRPAYPPELVDALADLAPGTALAWDAGCGSGQLSVALARRFGRVIATDPSEEQLSRAAPHPRVTYRRERAETPGLAAQSVDLAAAAQAAHWFDLPAYYEAVRRVCRPGALLAFVTYGLVRISPEIDAVVDRFYRDGLGRYWPPERRHVEAGYRSLPFPFEEIPAPALELRAEWTLERVVGFVRTWSAVRGLERDRGGDVMDAFGRELAAAWGDAATPRAVRWELALRLGRVA